MPVWLITIFKALASILGFLQEKQMLDAGRALERDDVSKAETKASEEVQQIINDIDTLPDNTVAERLSKWERD